MLSSDLFTFVSSSSMEKLLAGFVWIMVINLS